MLTAHPATKPHLKPPPSLPTQSQRQLVRSAILPLHHPHNQKTLRGGPSSQALPQPQPQPGVALHQVPFPPPCPAVGWRTLTHLAEREEICIKQPDPKMPQNFAVGAAVRSRCASRWSLRTKRKQSSRVPLSLPPTNPPPPLPNDAQGPARPAPPEQIQSGSKPRGSSGRPPRGPGDWS